MSSPKQTGAFSMLPFTSFCVKKLHALRFPVILGTNADSVPCSHDCCSSHCDMEFCGGGQGIVGNLFAQVLQRGSVFGVARHGAVQL